MIVERGQFLPSEPENSQPDHVFIKKRYVTSKPWYDAKTGQPFQPGVYYWVGGNTKMYGACLPRFRRSDFEEVTHHDGVSPAWPFSYDDLEPFYAKAEELFEVHGAARRGPDRARAFHARTPIRRSAMNPPSNGSLYGSASRACTPSTWPTACTCRRWSNDAPTPPPMDLPRRPATRATQRIGRSGPRWNHRPCGCCWARMYAGCTPAPTVHTVTAAEAQVGERTVRIEAKTFVVSGGAVNSAALLLRSVSDQHPDGLGNSSGLLGRNYMVHNSTFFLAVNPARRNDTAWQKTLGLNDWYEAGPDTPYPLGNLQMLGKLRAPMVKAARPWAPMWALKIVTDRSLDIYLTTEDLPRPDNRVTVDGDKIMINWTPNNLAPHQELVKRVSRAVRKAGYPIVLTERMGIATNSHMCGTAVAGTDPSTSVLDPDCRSHDVSNLFVVDSSFFPSSAALNPALTIAANALRVAPTIAASAEG